MGRNSPLEGMAMQQNQQEAKYAAGDGVYIDIENGAYVLTTEDGISETNRIVLEPEVLSAFFSYHENSDIVARKR